MKKETEVPHENAPRELNRLEVLRGLRIATWEISFATVWGTLTGGAFLTGYALWLGADNVALGLLTSIPTFAGLIQILSSYFGDRLRARKPFAASFFTLGRLLWLPILLLPLLLPRASSLYPFLALYALCFILQNAPIPAYMSWMSDLVPPDHRGRYFGRRNMIAGIVGMVISLPAAWFLDKTTKHSHHEAWGFGTLFGIGLIGALLSGLCLLRQPEPPKKTLPDAERGTGLKGILAYYRAPFADTNFRRLLAFNTYFVIGQFFAAPFYTVYALKVLHLDYIWLQALATLTSIASLGSMPLWGYLADKFGNKPLLGIGVCGVFTLPVYWIFTTTANPGLSGVLLVVNHLCGGLFWAGVGLTQFNLLIGFSPSEKTPIYVATMAAATGLAGGIAPLFGSALMRSFDGWHGHLLGLSLSNFHLAFAVSAFFRLSSLLFLRPVVDARAASAREVLEQIGRTGPRAWLHIRQLQKGGDVESKRQATEALAESRTRLALDELTTALRDPSVAVRVEAARALGEIGDAEATQALIAAIRDPASGVTEEAARALARLGDARAIQPLRAVLQDTAGHYTRRDRLEAARALGEIGGGEAVQALTLALTPLGNPPTDEEMAETLALSLGRTGHLGATTVLVQLLKPTETPRALRLAALRALGELAEEEALPTLRAALYDLPNDPLFLPPLADALARMGDRTSAPLLLAPLETLESPIARKQVTHAIGTLAGEGEAVYALLSQEEYGRDNAISRLVQELQRRTREERITTALDTALQSYIAGDYPACLHAIQAATPTEVSESETAALCQQLLRQTAETASPATPVEVVMLAFCLLRALA